MSAQRRLRLPLCLALGVTASSLAVYAATAARWLYWGDSAEFVAVARTLGIAHPPGYPLYTLLSALVVRVPFGSPFLRLSMLSAVFAAVTAGIVTLLVWEIVGSLRLSESRPWAVPARSAGALTAGVAFAFSSTVWSQATVPEVYTLSSALIFGVLFALVRWMESAGPRWRAGEHAPASGDGGRWVLLAGFLLGLGLAHHLTAVLVVPSIALGFCGGIRTRPSARGVAGALALVAAGLSFYIYLPARAPGDPAILWTRIDSFGDLVAHVSGTQYASRLFAEPLVQVARKLWRLLAGLPGELTWPVLALSGLGLSSLWRRSRVVFAVLVLEAVLVTLHAVNYRIPDIESYYLPVYGVLAVAAGLGLVEIPVLLERWPRAARIGVLVGATAVAGLSVLGHVVSDWRVRDQSDRADARVYMERMLDAALPGAIVLAQNDRTVFSLWYALFVDGRRDDLAVIDVRGRAPHFEKWFPDVRFPTEEELARYVGRSGAVPAGPPAMEVVPAIEYLPLLVDLNSGARPVYADVDIGRDVFPFRSVPRGLLVEIVPDGASAAAAGDFDRATWDAYLAGLEGAPGADPRTLRAYAKTLGDLGQWHLVRGEIGAALETLERARDLATDAPHVHNNLGVAYREAGRSDDAIREFRAALEINPGLAVAHYNIYESHGRSGDLVGAKVEITAASRLDPRNPHYKLALAGLCEQMGELDEAEALFRAVARSAPDDWAARLAYGDFLSRQRRYPEAVAAYARAEELNPAAPGVLTGLSRCYWEMNEMERAVEAMRRSVELQPHNPQLKYDLAVMLYRTGHPLEAMGQAEDVVRILPRMWQAHALKATILGEMGLCSEARRLFEKARELGADGPSFRGAWSAMERASGDTARARAIAVRLE